MKKAFAKFLPLLLLFAGESRAQTVTYDVSFGGNNYTLGRGNMQDYSLSELELIWSPQPWYGNRDLAEDLSVEVGFGLGGENGTYPSTHHNGVFFGYGVDTLLGRYQAVRTQVGRGPRHFNWGVLGFYFAVDCSVSSSFCASDDGDAQYSIAGDRYIGKTLSANRDSNDPDGNGSITGYTWQSSSDSSTWSTVGTDSTYTLTDSEKGKYLRLTVAYTDGESFSESVTTSNVQAKDFTTAMAMPFAALKSNNLEIINSYVKNSLLSSQQSCTTQGVEIFDGKACIHGNYFHTNRYTFGDSGNNSFQAHQTAGNYGFDYQVTDSLNIGLRYGSGTSGMDNDTNTTGTTSQASVDTSHWGLKATYEGEKNTFLSGYLGFTDFDVDLDRQSTTNDGTSTSAKSSFDGDAYSAGIKIAKVIPIKSNAVLVPELSATYSTYEQPQIIETGSGDLLTVDRTDSQSLLLRIGGKAVKTLKTNQDRYDANVYLGAWYEFDPYSTRNGEHQVSAQFTESSAAAVLSSSQSVQAQKVNFEAGGAVQLSDQFQLTLSGGLDLAADVSNSYVRGGMTWAF